MRKDPPRGSAVALPHLARTLPFARSSLSPYSPTLPVPALSSRGTKGRSATRRRVRHPLSGAAAGFTTGRGSSTHAWTSCGGRHALCACALGVPLCRSGGRFGHGERVGRSPSSPPL